MADPVYYEVTVNAIFYTYYMSFEPGVPYTVTDEVYNSKLGDGRNFKDLCVTAQQQQPTG